MNSKYVIILNWNGTEDSIACLESLRKVEDDCFRIILVDNDSEENEYRKLEKWCQTSFRFVGKYTQELAESGGISEVNVSFSQEDDSILLIRNSDNLGFAAGNNVALKYILTLGDESPYSLLLNNDTIVEPKFLRHLSQFLDDNLDYVACTPQIRLFDTKERLWNCGGNLTWFGNRKYSYAGAHIDDVPQDGFDQISYLTGCALFFRLKETGILTEKFFFGEEDFEFSLRMRKQSKKMACVYNSIIYHKVNGSVSKVMEKPLGTVYLFYLAKFIDNRDYVSRLKFLIIVGVNLLYAIPMIRFRYGYNFKQIFKMIKLLLRELKHKTSIDREYCFKYLKKGTF